MTRTTNRRSILVGTGAGAIDEDTTIGQAFTLGDVVVNLSAAATTSENLVISSKRTIGVTTYTCVEAVQDMSLLSAPEATSKIFRFDKWFPAGTEINVTFTNTDTLTVTIVAEIELDTIGS